MTTRRTSRIAVALLGTLATAACSGGSESEAPKAVIEPGTPTAAPTRSADGTLYPGETWQHADPAKLGFDPTAMRRIARDAKAQGTTCLLVARKGRVVGEWNWQKVAPDTPREVFSMTKSVTSTLVGQAQADGDLDIDQEAKKYIHEWRGTKSRGVTVKDILSNDSGRFWDFATDYGQLPQATDRTQFAIDLEQQYPPGEVWTYNNAAIQTLDRVISRATGTTTLDYAAERLFAPIGMTHSTMTTDPSGNTNTFFGLQTTCEDMARFGYLFLRHGRWLDDQVVPKAWVRAATGRPSQRHNAAYGYLWWLNRRGPILGPLKSDAPGQPPAPVGRAIPGAPANLFTAQGLGGQVVLVDPGSKTVVVRIGQLGGGEYGARDAARFVTEALVSP
jgi:CubicO group peptidase (beta-lactamase class C family)